jgi:hypothetical protein
MQIITVTLRLNLRAEEKLRRIQLRLFKVTRETDLAMVGLVSNY